MSPCGGTTEQGNSVEISLEISLNGFGKQKAGKLYGRGGKKKESQDRDIPVRHRKIITRLRVCP